MNARRSLFAVSAVALFLGGSYFAQKTSQRVTPEPRLRADGCDPVPLPYPKPTKGRAVVDMSKSSDSGILVVDGADPVPLPYPKSKGTLVGSSDSDAGVLVADGCDPVPRPYPRLV